MSRPRWPGSQPSTPPRISILDDHPAVPSGRSRQPGRARPGPPPRWICPRGWTTLGSSAGWWTPPPVKRWPRRSATNAPHPPARMTPATRGSAMVSLAEIAGRAADTTDRPTGTGRHDHRDPRPAQHRTPRWPGLGAAAHVAGGGRRTHLPRGSPWSWGSPPIRSTGPWPSDSRSGTPRKLSVPRWPCATVTVASIPAVSCRRIAASPTTSGPGPPAGPLIYRIWCWSAATTTAASTTAACTSPKPPPAPTPPPTDPHQTPDRTRCPRRPSSRSRRGGESRVMSVLSHAEA